MNQKIISALVYLQSLLAEAELDNITVSVSEDRTRVITEGPGEDHVQIIYVEDYPINPIKDVFEHINEEMCTDCIKTDYLYADTYFKSLTRAYVDSLVNEFGTNFPITIELAKAIVKHEVSEHHVFIAETQDGDRTMLRSDNLCLLEGKRFKHAYLKANKEELEYVS